MDRLIWTEDFSVGVRVLDAQHRRIIGMMNAIIPFKEFQVDSKLLSGALTAMTQYVMQHFKEEERLMEEHGYPGLDSQRSEHKQFLLKTVDFCTAEGLRVVGVPDKLQTYLREWWRQHILDEDMKYMPFFRRRGVR
jgi:hemerythrin